VTEQTKSDANYLPNAFITLLSHSTRVRRYTRCGNDDWNVDDWDGEWQFYDSIGDKTAMACFESAVVVAEIIEIPPKSQDNPTCITDPSSHFDWLVKFIEDVRQDSLRGDGLASEAASETCRVILEHAEFIRKQAT